jgi:hypothetical protein
LFDGQAVPTAVIVFAAIKPAFELIAQSPESTEQFFSVSYWEPPRLGEAGPSIRVTLEEKVCQKLTRRCLRLQVGDLGRNSRRPLQVSKRASEDFEACIGAKIKSDIEQISHTSTFYTLRPKGAPHRYCAGVADEDRPAVHGRRGRLTATVPAAAGRVASLIGLLLAGESDAAERLATGRQWLGERNHEVSASGMRGRCGQPGQSDGFDGVATRGLGP